MNIKAVFVYQLKNKPYTSKCVYIEDDHYGIDKRYSKDKNKQIEELYE